MFSTLVDAAERRRLSMLGAPSLLVVTMPAALCSACHDVINPFMSDELLGVDAERLPPTPAQRSSAFLFSGSAAGEGAAADDAGLAAGSPTCSPPPSKRTRPLPVSTLSVPLAPALSPFSSALLPASCSENPDSYVLAIDVPGAPRRNLHFGCAFVVLLRKSLLLTRRRARQACQRRATCL